MSEFTFDAYAGQLRPLTWRDVEVVAEVERELLSDLGRVQVKAQAREREARGHPNANAEEAA